MSIDAHASTAAAITELQLSLDPDQVSTDRDVLDEYSHDCWPLQTKLRMLGLHEHRPDVVVRARSAADVAVVIRVAAVHGIPLTARGLGSSVTGQPLPTRGGVVLDLGQLARVIEIDPVDLTVTVDAGWNGGALEAELNGQGLTLGHSPQSLFRSSVGGWLATAATGQFSSRYGGIEDLVVALQVVLADGQAVTVDGSPRSAVGPDLKRLFIGAEGTLGVITSVTLRVARLPESRLVEAFRLPDIPTCLSVMRAIVQSGQRPSLVRGYDEVEARHAMEDRSFDGCVLFLGNEGVASVAAAEHGWQREVILRAGGTSLGPDPVTAWLERRFDFSSVERRLALPGGYAETIEVAHTWHHIDDLYNALKARLNPLADEVNGHFSHAYTHGTSLYMIVFGTVESDLAAVDRLRQIWHAAMEVALQHGAVLSHHHGPGLARVQFLREAMGSSFTLLQRVKSSLDPQGLLNPGKLGLD